ncbi:VOC family protein [Oceanirhabdus seepicola]|uniref:VOC family protein n=1 Tax=Oceanirhabdus seepicola TaxID=2828781 RepID=A0A9J6NX82_9CLOT|nr:VOC family protein [Oceanirhabdus seepicola]MCM1989119.1 VOC family protein [Oceanirhabdus seepicola]
MEFIGICLVTSNVCALTEFYTKILCVEAEGNDVHAELKTDGGNIAIFSVEGMENMAPNSMCGAGYGGFTISFKVKDVDLEYERLKALGVEFVMLPKTHPWGARSFWFRDIDGNIVNFVSMVKKN